MIMQCTMRVCMGVGIKGSWGYPEVWGIGVEELNK